MGLQVKFPDKPFFVHCVQAAALILSISYHSVMLLEVQALDLGMSQGVSRQTNECHFPLPPSGDTSTFISLLVTLAIIKCLLPC